jgi:cell division protein FtsW (lipid II flippase)
LLGHRVVVAVPLQSQHPALVLALALAELAALAALMVTANLGAFVALVLLALALVVLAAVNRHRVLALSATGMVMLTASVTGRPLVLLGPAPADLVLPEPSGLEAAVQLQEQTWFVDRSAFPRLREARQRLRGGQSGDAE